MARERLKAHALDRVWSSLAGYPRLSSIAVSHRGAGWTTSLKEQGHARDAAAPTRRYRSGIRRASDRFEPFFIAGGIEDLDGGPDANRTGGELPWHLPKALIHWKRRTGHLWPIMAVPDYSGLVAFDDFFGVWPTDDVPAEVIAAVLNGHVANAYAASLGKAWDDGSGVLEDVPIPPLSDDLVGRIHDLVSTYRSERAHLDIELTREGIDRCLQLPGTIDDLVLKAYGLPPAVEAELLGHFAGEVRPGFERVMQIARQAPSPLPTRGPEPMSPEEMAAWHRSVEEADAAMEADLLRLQERLRLEQPELFDQSGAFREEKVQRELEQRVAQQKAADREDLAALVSRRARRSSDAS